MSESTNREIVFFDFANLMYGGGYEQNIIRLGRWFHGKGDKINFITPSSSLNNFFSFFLRTAFYKGNFSESELSLRLGSHANYLKFELVDLIFPTKKRKLIVETLLKSDLIYSKNEIFEIILLRYFFSAPRHKIIFGLHTPLHYEISKGLKAKLHNLFYNSTLYIWFLKQSRVRALVESDGEFFRRRSVTVEVIPNSIDIKKFPLKIHTKRDRFNILYIGRMTEQKGVDVLAQAIESLSKNKEFKNFNFIFVGSGEIQENLEELSTKFTNCSFHEFSNQVLDFYDQADLVVVPSRWEGLPATVLESQATGLPVLGTDISGIRDVIVKEKTGWLCKPGNVEDLSNSMLSSYYLWRDDYQKFISFGINGRGRIVSDYDESTINRALDDFFYSDANQNISRIKTFPKISGNFFQIVSNFIKNNRILLLIFLLSVTFRILSAFKMGWLTEEVFFIDYIEQWFTHNFFAYFFQFQHHIYPPRSPQFGTPPLGMWLQTIGVFLSNKFGFSELIGARSITLIFSQIGLLYVYKTGKDFFSERAGLLAAFFVAITPSIVAIDGSGELDSFLYVFLIIGIYYILKFSLENKYKYLYWAAVFAALACLVKVYACVIIFVVAIPLLFFFFKKKLPIKKLIYSALIILFLPIILWSGLRDPGNIQRTLGVVTSIGSFSGGVGTGGMFSEYQGVDGYSSKSIFYNVYMILGHSLPIVSLAGLILIPVFLFDVYRRSNPVKAKDHKWQATVVILGLILIASHFFAIYFLGGPNEVFNRILFSSVIFIIIVAVVIDYLLVKFIKDKIKQNVAILLLVAVSLSSIVFTNPRFYNTYNNFLIGGVRGASTFYRVGFGEGLDVASDWLNQNAPHGAIIYAPRVGFTSKYLRSDLTLAYAPLNESLDYALSQGSQYILLYSSFFSGSLNPEIGKQLKNYKVIHSVDVEGYPLVKIYAVDPSSNYTPINENFLPSTIKASSSTTTSRFIFKNDSKKINISYHLVKSSYGLIIGSISIPPESEGIEVTLTGNTNTPSDNLYIDIGLFNVGYNRFSIKYNWKGQHSFFIPFSIMKNKNKNYNIETSNYFRISIDNYNSDSNGQFSLDGLRFLKVVTPKD